VPSLDARLDAVVDGEVDFSISSISVTEARKTIVDFVEPYYYSAGATLFAPEGTVSVEEGWEGVEEETMCIEQGKSRIL
jgi:polar amino acid transport system substrate-binding protein